jgi:hypothetical protein
MIFMTTGYRRDFYFIQQAGEGKQEGADSAWGSNFWTYKRGSCQQQPIK